MRLAVKLGHNMKWPLLISLIGVEGVGLNRAPDMYWVRSILV